MYVTGGQIDSSALLIPNRKSIATAYVNDIIQLQALTMLTLFIVNLIHTKAEVFKQVNSFPL